MEYIYKYFNEKSHISIYSAKPEDLNTSIDIRAILLAEFPNLRNDYFIVSNPHENLAIVVGDNIHCQGMVKVHIEKSKTLKGVDENAKWHHCTIK